MSDRGKIWEGELIFGDQVISYGMLGKGSLLFMIHGMGGIWTRDLKKDPSLALLAKDFKIILPNLPGYFDSTPLPRYNLSDYSDALAKLCNRLEIRKAFFLGHSLGTYVVLDFAARYPELVEKVILVGAPIHFRGWESGIVRLIYPLAPILVRSKLLTEIFRGLVLWTPLKKWLDKDDSFQRVDLKALAFGFRLLRQEKFYLLSRKVGQPKLFLWGADDSLFSQEEARKLSLNPLRDEAVLIGKAGHEVMREAPYSYAARVRGFFLRGL